MQDGPVDENKEFPDTYLGMTGNRGKPLFKIQYLKNHGRLFLPEPLVLSTDEYAKLQKEEESILEAQEAKKWGMSVNEYREQLAFMRKAEKRKENELKHKSYLADHKSTSQKQLSKEPPVIRVVDNDHHYSSRSQHTPNHYQHENLTNDYSYPPVHHQQTQAVYQAEHSRTEKNPAVSSDHSHFTVGTMVKVKSDKGHPLCGVIKWVGTLPNLLSFDGLIAGVELVI